VDPVKPFSSPRLKAAWQQLAEQTVAGLTSTPLDQLTDVLINVAA